MEKKLETILYSVGVSHCYLGCRYFKDAVLMASEDLSKLDGIRKEIYLPIARKYNTSLYNVERNIRYIRDVMMKNGGTELLEEMTGCRFRHKNQLYPKEIIEIFAKYLLNE